MLSRSSEAGADPSSATDRSTMPSVFDGSVKSSCIDCMAAPVRIPSSIAPSAVRAGSTSSSSFLGAPWKSRPAASP